MSCYDLIHVKEIAPVNGKDIRIRGILRADTIDPSSKEFNVGPTASKITIGGAGTTTVIYGTTKYLNIQELYSKDSLISLNNNGTIDSVINHGAGFDILAGTSGIPIGYLRTKIASDVVVIPTTPSTPVQNGGAFVMKAPAQNGIIAFVPPSEGTYLYNQGLATTDRPSFYELTVRDTRSTSSLNQTQINRGSIKTEGSTSYIDINGSMPYIEYSSLSGKESRTWRQLISNESDMLFLYSSSFGTDSRLHLRGGDPTVPSVRIPNIGTGKGTATQVVLATSSGDIISAPTIPDEMLPSTVARIAPRDSEELTDIVLATQSGKLVTNSVIPKSMLPTDLLSLSNSSGEKPAQVVLATASEKLMTSDTIPEQMLPSSVARLSSDAKEVPKSVALATESGQLLLSSRVPKDMVPFEALRVKNNGSATQVVLATSSGELTSAQVLPDQMLSSNIPRILPESSNESPVYVVMATSSGKLTTLSTIPKSNVPVDLVDVLVPTSNNEGDILIGTGNRYSAVKPIGKNGISVTSDKLRFEIGIDTDVLRMKGTDYGPKEPQSQALLVDIESENVYVFRRQVVMRHSPTEKVTLAVIRVPNSSTVTLHIVLSVMNTESSESTSIVQDWSLSTNHEGTVSSKRFGPPLEFPQSKFSLSVVALSSPKNTVHVIGGDGKNSVGGQNHWTLLVDGVAAY